MENILKNNQPYDVKLIWLIEKCDSSGCATFRSFVCFSRFFPGCLYQTAFFFMFVCMRAASTSRKLILSIYFIVSRMVQRTMHKTRIILSTRYFRTRFEFQVSCCLDRYSREPSTPKLRRRRTSSSRFTSLFAYPSVSHFLSSSSSSSTLLLFTHHRLPHTLPLFSFVSFL